jgi:hypothetical protein
VTTDRDHRLSWRITQGHRVAPNPLISLTGPPRASRHSQLPKLGVAASGSRRPLHSNAVDLRELAYPCRATELPPSGEDVMLCDSEMVTRTGGSRTRPRPPGRNADDPGEAARVSAEVASAGIRTSSLDNRREFPSRAACRRVLCPNQLISKRQRIGHGNTGSRTARPPAGACGCLWSAALVGDTDVKALPGMGAPVPRFAGVETSHAAAGLPASRAYSRRGPTRVRQPSRGRAGAVGGEGGPGEARLRGRQGACSSAGASEPGHVACRAHRS